MGVGELLPYCENQMTEGLYHHGEEPHRPGYTLQEIIQLSRSSVLQQRTTALYTLANILNRVISASVRLISVMVFGKTILQVGLLQVIFILDLN